MGKVKKFFNFGENQEESEEEKFPEPN